MRIVCLGAGILGMAILLASAPSCSAEDKKLEGNWVQLFNGKDLTGWKVHPMTNPSIAEVVNVQKDGKVVAIDGKMKDDKIVHLWRVEDGLLIGGGPASHLFSERGDYVNFHYRIEAKINDQGNSGQYFRTAFGPNFPKGYEAQINATHRDKIKTGSLYFPQIKEVLILDKAPHQPDEWFTQEVICIDDTITVLVNGKKTIDNFKDPMALYKKGHFALQGHDPGSIMTFRKVEVKELPAK